MKNKLKILLILLIYALCFIILWGECFLSYNANYISSGIALAVTFLSCYFIQKEFGFNLSIWQKLFFLSLLLGYSLLFIDGDLRLFIFSPLMLGLIFIVMNLFVFKDLSKFRNWILFVLLMTFYLNGNYFKGWKNERWGIVDEKSIIIDDSNKQTQEKRQESPDVIIDISSFSFLDLKSDTVNIKTDKHYIFIGTWNEDCAPCKKAIRELTPMLNTVKNVESYFVYETHKFDKNVFISAAGDGEYLKNQKVIADYNQEFFKSTKMVAYPTFLIIDNKEGKIIYMAVGYGKAGKSRLIKKLTEISK
ncbi:MAG: hypothetical protein WCY25_10920 [Moheibacter sp.]